MRTWGQNRAGAAWRAVLTPEQLSGCSLRIRIWVFILWVHVGARVGRALRNEERQPQKNLGTGIWDLSGGECVPGVPRRVVFKAHRLLYHSTLGSRVIKEKKTGAYMRVRVGGALRGEQRRANERPQRC